MTSGGSSGEGVEMAATIQERWHIQPLDREGGVTSAVGFRASGVHCGLKNRRPDLALIASDRPCTLSALFTRNQVRAAPVVFSEALAASGSAVRALICNSGNANACTGEQGLEDAREMARLVAKDLGIDAGEVFVASTGVIGVPLDMTALRRGVPVASAELSADGGEAAAQAILTTDTCVKQCATRISLSDGAVVNVGGIAKGSGMIQPDLGPPHATTLAFVTTDAQIDRATLDLALAQAVEPTFNSITVDGDTSTNDCVAVLANGASGVAIGGADDSFETFVAALQEVLLELAKGVVRDGEGATRLIEVQVSGTESAACARQVAFVVANSPLVKTAFHAGEPNWGRLMMAVGRAGVPIDAADIAIAVGGLPIVSGGAGVVGADLDRLTREMLRDEVSIEICVGKGPGQSTVYTCDLSKEYVDINSSYIS